MDSFSIMETKAQKLKSVSGFLAENTDLMERLDAWCQYIGETAEPDDIATLMSLCCIAGVCAYSEHIQHTIEKSLKA